MATDSTAIRPEPWGYAPYGFHFETFHPTDWEMGGGGRICRQKGCRNDAVATLYRTARYSTGPRQMPWRYCADHLYGAWIEDGQVTRWKLVKDGRDV